MTKRGAQVLMIGTDPSGKGGVASVVDVYRCQGLFDQPWFRYVVTHRGGSLLAKLVCAVSGGLTIARLLLGRKVSLVHAHVSSHGSFKRKAVYLGLARWLGIPTVFHLHSGGFQRFVDQEASPLLRRWIVYTLRQSSGLIALSESWATYLRSLAPDVRIWVVPNPVEVPDEALLREGEPGRLLFLGRASQSKGVFDLLRAFAALSSKYPQARLAIGGDGDLDYLQQQINELGVSQRVEVLGWVSGSAKELELTRCQVYVLPSYHEGMPMGMLEAMALAKAVVVTPVGGVPEAVQQGVHGLLVEPGDVPGLECALAELLVRPELRHALGSAARACVLERFASDGVISKVRAVYAELGVIVAEGSRA